VDTGSLIPHRVLWNIRGGFILLVILFFFAQYAVDAARYGDFNPTDVAQEENLNDLKEIDPPEKKAYSHGAVDHTSLKEANFFLLRTGNNSAACCDQVMVLSQYPSEFALTSRPPPVC